MKQYFNNKKYIIVAVLLLLAAFIYVSWSPDASAVESCDNIRILNEEELQACRIESSEKVSFYQSQYQRESEHAALLREELQVTEASLRSFNSLAESQRVKMRIINRLIGSLKLRQETGE